MSTAGGVNGRERRQSWRARVGEGTGEPMVKKNYGKISVMQLDLSVGHAANVYMSEPVSVS